VLQEICKKSIPILPDALARSEGLFIRNEGVPKYVPQVLSKYDPTGITVTDAELNALNIVRASFHGEWNYTIKPQDTLVS
jgi:hypothetical protein